LVERIVDVLPAYPFFVKVRVSLLHIRVELGPAMLAVIDAFSLIVGARRESYLFAGQVARRTRAASPDQHAVIDEKLATFRARVSYIHS
jgi:hypothetical protein